MKKKATKNHKEKNKNMNEAEKNKVSIHGSA